MSEEVKHEESEDAMYCISVNIGCRLALLIEALHHLSDNTKDVSSDVINGLWLVAHDIQKEVEKLQSIY
jgi:hypothetical protein